MKDKGPRCPSCGCACPTCLAGARRLPPWLRKKAKLRTRDVLVRVTRGGRRRGRATSKDIARIFKVALFEASRRLHMLQKSGMLRRTGSGLSGQPFVYMATDYGLSSAASFSKTRE